MLNDLEPLPHFKLTDYVRVPVWKSGKEYIVYIGRNHVRRYTLTSLPSFISSKITIANVLSNDVKPDSQLRKHEMFMCEPDNGDEDTSWRASESMYVVIIHLNDFYYLQGEFIGDPRKENQRKSKKDSK